MGWNKLVSELVIMWSHYWLVIMWFNILSVYFQCHYYHSQITSHVVMILISLSLGNAAIIFFLFIYCGEV